MHQCELFKKHGEVALIKTTIAETNAMRVIRNNGGFITGPFEIEAGSERWEVGFDGAGIADDTLAELEVNNEFSVEERNSLELDPMFDLMKNTDAAETLLEACRELSETERQTLAVAAEKGYFNQPRGATLQMLANEFDVSDTAVSKNVRRAERKILKRVVDAMDTIEDTR